MRRGMTILKESICLFLSFSRRHFLLHSRHGFLRAALMPQEATGALEETRRDKLIAPRSCQKRKKRKQPLSLFLDPLSPIPSLIAPGSQPLRTTTTLRNSSLPVVDEWSVALLQVLIIFGAKFGSELFPAKFGNELFPAKFGNQLFGAKFLN